MRDGRIMARFSSRIWKTCIMNGTSPSSSNHALTCSFRTDGAKGRKLSLLFNLAIQDVFHIRAARVADD